MPNPRKKFGAMFYDAAERLNTKLEGEIESWPWSIRAFLVFLLGGLAGEEWEEKPYLSYALLGLGIFIAIGAVTFGCRDDKKKRKGQKGKQSGKKS
jgi:hypothetical protein